MAITKLLRCYVCLFRFATITQVGTPPDGKKLDRALQRLPFIGRIIDVVNHFFTEYAGYQSLGQFCGK